MTTVRGQSGNTSRLEVRITETPREDNVLQIVIEEYHALRTEIQYRSEFQHRFLQLHITTLTIILGAALSPLVSQIAGANLSQLIGPELILLIPIESSIFGLWYLDHEITIFEIGAYIRTIIASKAAQLVQDPNVMRWEAAWRMGVLVPHRRRAIRYRGIVALTFAGPSILAQITTALLLLLSNPSIRDILRSLAVDSRLPWLASLVAWLVQVPAYYSGPIWWLVAFIWIIAAVLIVKYMRSQSFRSKLSEVTDDEALRLSRMEWFWKQQ
jgi:hypothetical protein